MSQYEDTSSKQLELIASLRAQLNTTLAELEDAIKSNPSQHRDMRLVIMERDDFKRKAKEVQDELNLVLEEYNRIFLENKRIRVLEEEVHELGERIAALAIKEHRTSIRYRNLRTRHMDLIDDCEDLKNKITRLENANECLRVENQRLRHQQEDPDLSDAETVSSRVSSTNLSS